MTTINLTPEPLTAENFNQFGDVLSIENKDSITINDGFANKFADLAKIDTQEEGGETSVHIFVAKKRQFPLQITMLEKHPFFSQTFIPKGQTPFIVVVSPPAEDPIIENIKVFNLNIKFSNGEKTTIINKVVRRKNIRTGYILLILFTKNFFIFILFVFS